MLKIAIAQIDTVLGDKQKNLSHIKEYCRKAASNQANIICFPELVTTGYSPDVLGTELWTFSELRGGETDQLLSSLSQNFDLTIIYGFIERGESLGEIYNSAGVWVPGGKSWKGTFRKIHLVDSERNWFLSGTNIPVFDTPMCKIGIMICHDAGFPEIARILTLSGADILFLPAAWCIDYKDIWNINCASRALENGTHLVAVNRCGKEEKINFFGDSQLINPRGKPLTSTLGDGEGLVFGYVDFNLQAKTRLELPYLRGRRKDLYNIDHSLIV